MAVLTATTEVTVSQMAQTNPQAKLLVMQNESQRLDTEDLCESSQGPAELSWSLRQCTGPLAELAWPLKQQCLVNLGVMPPHRTLLYLVLP